MKDSVNLIVNVSLTCMTAEYQSSVPCYSETFHFVLELLDC